MARMHMGRCVRMHMGLMVPFDGAYAYGLLMVLIDGAYVHW
jgi:hypothetical protein